MKLCRMWNRLVVVAAAMTMSVSAQAVEKVTCRVELDRAVLPAGVKQKAIVKVTLDAPAPLRTVKRPPVNLAIVLDRSGSMQGEKIRKAKDGVLQVLNRLDARDLFAFVIYNHQVETRVPARHVRDADAIASSIRGITAAGNTALFGGVSQGAAEVRKALDQRCIHRIILLSDGLANVGPSLPADLGRLGASLVKEGISVSTVGVGTDYNEDLMTQLAQKSDGNTFFVKDSSDLPRIFAVELGEVLNVVARQVHLEVVFPDNVRPLRIIGRDGRVGPDKVELSLNQLYGDQEKYALIEVEIPATEEKDTRQIAFATISYQDAFNEQRETVQSGVMARFSRRQQEVIQSANGAVQQVFIDNVAAMAVDETVDLWDKGERKKALYNLEKQQRQLNDLVVQYNLDPSVLDSVNQLEEDAERLRNEGMDKSGRKEMRTRSYHIRNQQMAN